MKKALYEVQDLVDGAYALLDELSEAVNELLTENEKLKTTLRTKELKALADKRLKEIAKEVTEEEQFYLDYFKEYYGKELE